MRKIFLASLIILIFSLLFVGYFHRVTAFTQDLGRHILLGNIILKTHTIPHTNLFSYTYPDFPFLNHHWLSEVLFSLIFNKTGALDLLLFTTALAMLSFGMVFWTAFKKAPLSAIASSLILVPVLLERTDIRPEMLSFLLFSTFLVVLFNNRSQHTKLIYLLPFLMVIWVNLHIYFFLGIVLLILFTIDGFFLCKRNLWCNYTRALLLVLFFSITATLFNPHFLSGALYPLNAFKNYGYTIEENQTIFLLESLGFHKQSIDFFKVSVLLLFITLLINFKKVRPIDWLLSLTFTFVGAVAVRNLPLFALAVLIPLSIHLSSVYKKAGALFKNSLLQQKQLLYVFFLALITLSFWEISSVHTKNTFGFHIDPGATAAVDFFKKEGLRGPIFNNFDIGSYLAYRLYPDEKVFIDGRPEAYPASFFKDVYIPMQEHQSIFKSLEEKYHFNTIFFSHTDQTPWATTFLAQIVEDPSWVPIYLDQTVIIFTRNIPQNDALIRRFGMDPHRLRATYDQSDLRSLLQLASFFSKLNDQDAVFRLAQQIISISPNNCQALYARATIALSKADPLSQAYIQNYRNNCHGKEAAR